MYITYNLQSMGDPAFAGSAGSAAAGAVGGPAAAAGVTVPPVPPAALLLLALLLLMRVVVMVAAMLELVVVLLDVISEALPHQLRMNGIAAAWASIIACARLDESEGQAS